MVLATTALAAPAPNAAADAAPCYRHGEPCWKAKREAVAEAAPEAGNGPSLSEKLEAGAEAHRHGQLHWKEKREAEAEAHRRGQPHWKERREAEAEPQRHGQPHWKEKRDASAEAQRHGRPHW
jgi:hypothetical protein